MPVSPTYPGVYIEEVPSEVRTITGVATSVTAFIGRALRGATDDPTMVHSFAEFQREFGSLWRGSPLGYAVNQYFQNGGKDALIVRVFRPVASGAEHTTVATCTARYALLVSGQADLVLSVASPGEWGNHLQVSVDYKTADPSDTALFNLQIDELDESGTSVVATERFRNLSLSSSSSRYLSTVLEQQSKFVRVQSKPATEACRPNEQTVSTTVSGFSGHDGDPITDAEVSNAALKSTRQGIWALDKADIFNLLCIPPFKIDPEESGADVGFATWDAAQTYCEDHRAMLIIDPPWSWQEPSDVLSSSGGVDDTTVMPARSNNSAVYFPRVYMADPLQENRMQVFAPCGAVAGIYARTDAGRGVWKAPAGQDATLKGVLKLAYKMTDAKNGDLNPMGVNCLRKFPVSGNVVWGARTTSGADRLASSWKYVPVRRVALYIEESLYRGTQWVIFEPNDEPLWAQIRLNAGAFMHNLFRQGAFQGSSPRQAYFVKCDSETTTQNDIDRGIVNLLVGFAPLKPAEFLIIKISQIAGAIQT